MTKILLGSVAILVLLLAMSGKYALAQLEKATILTEANQQLEFDIEASNASRKIVSRLAAEQLAAHGKIRIKTKTLVVYKDRLKETDPNAKTYLESSYPASVRQLLDSENSDQVRTPTGEPTSNLRETSSIWQLK